MLYVMPVPVGAVTVIVPVALAQVGCCVTLAVGAAGVEGCGLSVKVVPEGDIQPPLLFAVTVYVPTGILSKIPVVFV